jgi:hypothetical protein
MSRSLLFAFAGFVCLATASLQAEPLSRAETLRIAESYVQLRWTATGRNVRHGRDASGIEVHTPDRVGGHGDPATDCWLIDAENTGVAYKWGGFDTPAAFTAGVRAGQAAGDVYTPEKRRKSGEAVTGDAVGIDCSGFVSRCWKLTRRQSTATIPGICNKLPSAADLRPGDVMNTVSGHVLLFVKWLDEGKTRARFYEAAPFSKTRATDREINEMVATGYQPLRYRQIVD